MILTAHLKDLTISYKRNKLKISNEDFSLYIDIYENNDQGVFLGYSEHKIINDFDSKNKIKQILGTLEFNLILKDYKNISDYVLDIVRDFDEVEEYKIEAVY
tara:strand:+ start:126 stop:431 length:306 start_codon:yes stop_codon:yes gene_type:complete